jgi:serine phosphatase RsbU (regulator of sigma subunit)
VCAPLTLPATAVSLVRLNPVRQLNSAIVLPMTLPDLKTWLFKLPKRGTHLHRIPLRQLWVLLVAVFLLFCVVGFYIDIMNGGKVPYLIVFVIAVVSGLNSAIWVVVLAKTPRIVLGALIVAQFFIGRIDSVISNALDHLFHPPEVPGEQGIQFAATCILVLVIVSYSFFTRYMGIRGKETYKLQNELELAHSIQKTLVPPISRKIGCFEIYGISQPSEKVGGDLVDVVELGSGDAIAYLADIAGHGLQAGILMGMLKTAARTALTGDGGGDGALALSSLMSRLNVVLPQVKEAHMYATFTALRLNLDGLSFYGMAASPPLLHWSASNRSVATTEEKQFPLGLLPVSQFPANNLIMEAGDVIVIATDGILEVCPKAAAKRDQEFGIAALASIVNQNAAMPLPDLASLILSSVRSYGAQFDDQTLLLVRRCAA